MAGIADPCASDYSSGFVAHHYENMPMQSTIFFCCKNENFHWKNIDINFLFLLKT